MKIRRLNTGIQTLAQSQRGRESSELVACRFEYDNDEVTITVGGANGQSTYVVSSSSTSTTTKIEENGDLLLGLTKDTELTLYDDGVSTGQTTTLGELLSSWNTETNAQLFLLRLNEGAEGHFELGVEDYVILPFTTAEPVHFNIGDYIDLNMALDMAQGKQFAKRYEVCEFPKPTLNVSTGGYDYELRLDAYYMKWKNKIFRYIPQEVELGEQAQGEASWSLTASLDVHLGVLLRNLTSLGYTYGQSETPFEYEIPTAYKNTAKLVTYDGVNIIDALSQMAETWECEWWVTDNVIHFGTCEQGTAIQVEIGVEAEQMSRTDSQGTFATRLYAFGSERNLQANYRETEDEVLVNGVVQRRLMLPESVPFVDAWKYESDGTRVYTTAYKTKSDGTKVYYGQDGYDTTEGDIHVGGVKVTQSRDADNKVVLTRTYFNETEYVALKAMSVEEVIEGIIQTDDIYPRQDDTVAAVSLYVKKFDRSQEGDEGEVVFDDLQEQWQGQTFNPDSVGLGATEYLSYYYRVKSTVWGEDFDEDYIMSGETLSLVFTGGALNGMEFEVMFLGGTTYESYDGKKWFELVANENYGRQLPDKDLCPAVGDAFVLYNWQAIDPTTGDILPMMQELIDIAERELLAYALEYLQDTMVDDGVYETELNPAWVYDEKLSEGTERDAAYSERTFEVGQKILLVNDALFDIPRESRVLGFVVNIDVPYDHPTYKVGESAQYSRIGAVESKVNQIIYNGGSYTSSGSLSGSGGSGVYLVKTSDSISIASDSNALSSLKALNTLLRKDQDDTTPYNLTVRKVLTMIQTAVAESGVKFGRTFVTGLLGEGGYIDGTGAGELDSLTLRKWLEVPEIRFNRTTVMTGITWNTVGGGKIESVEIDTDKDGNELASGIITLKLEEGEIGMVAENDLCMGIFHDFDNSYVNDDYNEDQRNGNFHTAGFGTVYFRVDEILEEGDNSRFHYVLRGTDGTGGSWAQLNHPRAYMEFACYGNLKNTDRQRCKYTTTEYEIRLKNMNFWEYGSENIYYIAGLLDGFQMGDTVFSGDGIVIGNGYFYGTLQQFENMPYYMNIDTQGDQFISYNDTQPYSVTCTVWHGWEELTAYVTSWGITRETGDTASDAVWNASDKAKAFAGSIELEYSDLGTNYSTVNTLFVLTASGDDSEGQPFSVTHEITVK